MQKRNTNIELMRMICMFLIIMHHAILYSDVLSNSGVSLNKYIAAILYIGGKYGTNVFFSITAYFLIDKTFHLKRVLSVWKTTFFYGVVFFVLNIFTRFRAFRLRDICETLLPISYKAYWFVTAYVALVILSQFLNLLIHKLDKKALGLLVIVCTCMVTIPATFLPGANPYADGSHLFLSVLIYLAVGFYKKWIELENSSDDSQMPKIRRLRTFFLGIACIGFLWMVLSAILIITLNKASLNGHITYWMSGESLPMLMFSLGTIVIIFNKPAKENKLILAISGGIFDIYLIHMNHFVYLWLWNKMFRIQEYYHTPFFFIKIIGVSVLVFLVCIVIGNIRKLLSDYLNSKIKLGWIDKLCMQVNQVMNM